MWLCFMLLCNLTLSKWVDSNEEDLSVDLWVVSLHQAVNYPSLTSSVTNNTFSFFSMTQRIEYDIHSMIFGNLILMLNILNRWTTDPKIKTSVCGCCCNSDYGRCLYNTRLRLLIRWYYWDWVIWSNGIDISCISCV